MLDKLFESHYSYKDLCAYLENKFLISPEKRAEVVNHLDGCKVCWSTWNRVRWDAAWVKQGTQELREYLGNRFEKYYDSSWALAQDWIEQSPRSKQEIQDFYRTTSHYLYNSIVFYESGDRYNLRPYMERFFKGGSVKTVLDYGCGVGNDTLALLDVGYEVFFADLRSPQVELLKWRLAKRGYKDYFDSHYLDVEHIASYPKVDMVWAIDVLEHMYSPEEVFSYFTDHTKVFLAYIDSSDTASGRHPFHFNIHLENFGNSLKNKDFHLNQKDGHISVWLKNGVEL